jgi:hypothetical protein
MPRCDGSTPELSWLPPFFALHFSSAEYGTGPTRLLFCTFLSLPHSLAAGSIYPNGDSVSCVNYDNREPGPIPVWQCRFRPKAPRYPKIARVTRDRRMPVTVAVRHHAGDWQSATATDLVTGTASVHNLRTLAATSDPDTHDPTAATSAAGEALSATVTVTPSRTRLACDSAWL